MQLSNIYKSFTKYLLSIVDISLEVIRTWIMYVDSETKDLEPPVIYPSNSESELTSRIVQLMKLGMGYFRWNILCALLFLMK